VQQLIKPAAAISQIGDCRRARPQQPFFMPAIFKLCAGKGGGGGRPPTNMLENKWTLNADFFLQYDHVVTRLYRVSQKNEPFLSLKSQKICHLKEDGLEIKK
jgi:hypothetical protein